MGKPAFHKEIFDEVLPELATFSDSQLSDAVRKRIADFIAVPHTDREVFLFLDNISKNTRFEISSFVQVLCDVRRFYEEPVEVPSV